MFRRTVCSFAALAFLAGTLVAAADDPWVGTWKLDTAKSVYTNHPKPKELTLTITDEGATQTYAFKGTAADGSPIKMQIIAPADGGQVTGFPVSSAYDTAILKHLSATSNEIIYSKAGKEVAVRRVRLSPDHKTMTARYTGPGAQGQKRITQNDVWHRE